MLPRILDIDVNNYDGTINIICDKTNKIEWFADELIETKYNFGRTFKTKFSVKDLKYKNLFFKLTGPYGKVNSYKFTLLDFE